MGREMDTYGYVGKVDGYETGPYPTKTKALRAIRRMRRQGVRGKGSTPRRLMRPRS